MPKWTCCNGEHSTWTEASACATAAEAARNDLFAYQDDIDGMTSPDSRRRASVNVVLAAAYPIIRADVIAELAAALREKPDALEGPDGNYGFAAANFIERFTPAKSDKDSST